ncbi:MAG: tyrosine-type recombinase/integrase [Stellaceae bacterium]
MDKLMVTEGPIRKVLTDRSLKALKPAAPGKRYIIWDAVHPYLGVRVTETGARSFVVVRRRPGVRNPDYNVLGAYPALSLKEAREAVPAILATITSGKRPREVEVERRRKRARQEHETCAAAIASYIADERGRGLRTNRETEAILRQEFLGQIGRREEGKRTGKIIDWSDGRNAIWRDRPVSEITRRDVIERLDEIKARGGKYASRRSLGAIRRFFNWCADGERFGIEVSPCANVRDKTIGITGRDLKRSRVLNDGELREVWHAADTLGYPFGRLVQVLTLTGQRLNDIARAQWSEIDLDAAMLVVPPARFKTGVAQEVALAPCAVELLKAMPRFAEGFAFSTTASKRPISGWSKMKSRLDAAIARERQAAGAEPMPPWVLHDLRRTVRTRLVSDLGVEAFIAERVIGHALPGLHAVDDQGSHRPQKRAALEQWAERLHGIVEPMQIVARAAP